MNKLIIKRPKNKEELYSEAMFKIYINEKFVEKIGQDEVKEIETTNNVIPIRVTR